MPVKKVKAELVLDLSNPIVQVILPLKKDAAERAEQYAKLRVSVLRDKLKANNWDADKVAPYPKGFGYNWVQVEEYQFCHAVTEWDMTKQPGGRNMHDPCTVKMNSHKVKKFVEKFIKQAEAQYDLFVLKLTEKIGKTKTASLEGNHVWLSSVLTVVLANGETQKWFTQQIYNVSKLGLQFPQWPTRKMK